MLCIVRAQQRAGRLQAIEVLALDTIGRIDIGGQLVTRRLVEERWAELSAHADTCECGLCVMLPLASVTAVWRLSSRWQRDINTTKAAGTTSFRAVRARR